MNKPQKDFVLCCDVGTSYIKTALVDKTGGLSSINRTHIPKDPLLWLETFVACSKAVLGLCLDYTPKVRAICISGNGPTVITQDGKAVFWNTDTKDFVFENKNAFFMPKLQALKAWYPLSFAKSDFIFGAPEYLIYMLTGSKINIIPTPRFEEFYIGMQKNAVLAGTVAGVLKKNIANELALFDLPKVICGCPDFLAAMIGTNCLESGKLCNRAGTSEAFNLVTPTPIYAKGLRTMPSFIQGLWNIGSIIEQSSHTKKTTPKSLLNDIKKSVDSLKKAVICAGFKQNWFTKQAIVTGGQTCDIEFLRQKAKITGLSFVLPQCNDSELLGVAALAWVTLGEYKDIKTAAQTLFKVGQVINGYI